MEMPLIVKKWSIPLALLAANLPGGFLLTAQIVQIPPARGPQIEGVVRAVTRPGVITTRQQITPAGMQSVFDGRVYGVTFGATSSEVWVLGAHDVFALDWRANKIDQRFSFKGSPGLQSILYDRRSKQLLYSVAAPAQAPRVLEPYYIYQSHGEMVSLFAAYGGTAKLVASNLGRDISGALATNGKLALVPLIHDDRLAVVDLATGHVLRTALTGIAPFGAVMSADGQVAWVTNWGGRFPDAGDPTSPTGYRADADKVVVDSRGISATGTVNRIDLESGRTTALLAVGLQPTAIIWDEPHQLLYVADSNTDQVTVINTITNLAVRTISIHPFAHDIAGVAPTALLASHDGSTLYVACGGLNAVAVIQARSGQLEGLLPTAWYPDGLALSADGKYLAVSTLLGVGSGWRGNPHTRYVHAYRGSVSVIPIPDELQLEDYTATVAEDNRIPRAFIPKTRVEMAANPPSPIPAGRTASSLISHVVYVIKENRTYDQVLGDLKQGNGDASIELFGNNITPNHHRLAEQFVLLDNFYATGGDSGDGHQWLTQANETSYCMWPGFTGRSYPADGSDPIAYSSSGFIWDEALSHGKTVKVFGEFAGHMPEPPQDRVPLLERWEKGEDFTHYWHITAPIKPLNNILARNYPSASGSIPDQIRAQIFLADLKKWEQIGMMPNLTILWLPSDHTMGALPGVSTPQAMVADNDLALGKVVDALTHSQFWKEMAIFVVEDDAQSGVDHVDGHRTVALLASPYARRGYVDSTFYSQLSMVKTIELILNLPPITLFDAIANDMRPAFLRDPDYTPYQAVIPRQSLFDANPPLKALSGAAKQGALASMRMRFDIADAAPADQLNRIIWHLVRGWKIPYPERTTAPFSLLAAPE